MSTRYQIAVIGDAGVGKTTWLHRLRTGEFLTDYQSSRAGRHVDLEMAATSAATLQHRNIIFDCIEANNLSVVSSMTKGVVIMCDLTEQNSYNRALWHLQELRKIFPGVAVVVVGNKIDCKGIANHMKFFSDVKQYQISAKSNYNFEKPLQCLLRQITGDDTWHFVPGKPVAPPVALAPVATTIRLGPNPVQAEPNTFAASRERKRV